MIPLFIISKDGVKSMEACEILSKSGFLIAIMFPVAMKTYN